MPIERTSEVIRSGSVTNVTLALAVLHELGGAERFVDIEEIAYRLFELAPTRFGWRTREFPSWERARTALVHANQEARRRGKPPLAISNKDGEAWRLTADGVSVAREYAGDKLRRGVRTARAGKAADKVREIRRHQAFIRYCNGTPATELERHVVADLLLCPPDVSLAAIQRKVDVAKAAAVAIRDETVTRFLEEVQSEVTRKWSH